MSNYPPKIHMDEVERMTIGNGEQFAATIGRIGMHLGAKKIGCNIVELEPGKRAWPHHLHYGMDELFIILQGEGTLRYDDDEYGIKQGEVFYAGTGPGTAHQIINTSDAMLKYLALSTMEDPELCYYPDSKKYGAYYWQDQENGVRFIAREDAATDYYEGEE